MNITIITSGSKARSTPACVITRGMTRAITAASNVLSIALNA